MTDYIAFKCEVCLKHFKHKVSLDSHMQNMHTLDKNDNNFLCKVCSEEFSVKYALKNHIAEVHILPEKLISQNLKQIKNSHEKLKCTDCNTTFSSKDGARSHYKRLHVARTDGIIFICKLCNEEFTMKYLLKNHLQEIHGRTKIPKEIVFEKLKPIEDGCILYNV